MAETSRFRICSQHAVYCHDWNIRYWCSFFDCSYYVIGFQINGFKVATPHFHSDLHAATGLWDYPIMKLVADSRGRLTAADLFRPGTAFDASPQPDGSIRIVELVEKKLPPSAP